MSDLDPARIVRIARFGEPVAIDESVLERVDAARARMLAALPTSGPVYGVTTGMGALSEVPLDATVQDSHQERLMLARAVGGPPWLDVDEVRAALAVRLRTFLDGDAAVGAALCRQLVAFLDGGVHPAVPRTRSGSAGEVLALAHLAAPLVGGGAVLDPSAVVPAPIRLGPKEGVALIEGVPVTTALAILRSVDARDLLARCRSVLACEFALTGSARDSLHPALARGDEVLAAVTVDVARRAGSVDVPRTLQPPVSFRVSAQMLATAERAVDALDAAVARALDGVTDSPYFLPDQGRFLGTAGFGGHDLAFHLQSVASALVAVAEIGAARLHRLLDPRVTGLGAQLSPAPGVQTGLAPVHKRAVGVVHDLRRAALPATVGFVETSAGQEDVQSFSLEAAESVRTALDGLLDVLACEHLAVHQLTVLGARLPADADGTVLADLAEVLPADADDRPWGLDVELLRGRLGERPMVHSGHVKFQI